MVTIKCDNHPGYDAKEKPLSNCLACKTIYWLITMFVPKIKDLVGTDRPHVW